MGRAPASMDGVWSALVAAAQPMTATALWAHAGGSASVRSVSNTLNKWKRAGLVELVLAEGGERADGQRERRSWRAKAGAPRTLPIVTGVSAKSPVRRPGCTPRTTGQERMWRALRLLRLRGPFDVDQLATVSQVPVTTARPYLLRLYYAGYTRPVRGPGNRPGETTRWMVLKHTGAKPPSLLHRTDEAGGRTLNFHDPNTGYLCDVTRRPEGLKGPILGRRRP
ncbi:MAG: hypothetical protein RQ833_07375 [Sphingomonadaceae bacterium]|nr:hypothetical protein [Sphingomonadaceae bacterium]